MTSAPVVFDDFPNAAERIPDLTALKVKRVDRPGSRLDAAYDLLARVFDPNVLDAKDTYVELLSPDGLKLDGFPLICLAACFEIEGQEVLAGAISANLMWVDQGKVLQLVIGNIAKSPLLKKKQFRGVGTSLLNAVIYLADGIADAHTAELAYVVAEAESGSLGFWQNSDFLWPAGLEYLQPPLEFDADGKRLHDEVRETFLVRPLGRRSRIAIETTLLQSMIHAIYRNWCLDSNSRKLSWKALQSAEAYIMKQVYPRVLSSIEKDVAHDLTIISDHTPRCVFSKCAIVLHFVCVPEQLEHGKELAQFFNCNRDDVLESIERDLLACNHREGCLFDDDHKPYRDGRPFRSHVIRLGESSNTVGIKFPDTITYQAEGKNYSYRNRRDRNCRIAAFQTTFQCQIGIWSLALTPVENEPFDEIDIIALAKLWEGGEGVGIEDKNCSHCKIRFDYKGRSLASTPLSNASKESNLFATLFGRLVNRKSDHQEERSLTITLDPKRTCESKEAGITASEVIEHIMASPNVVSMKQVNSAIQSVRMRLAGGTIQIVRPHGLDSHGNVVPLELDDIFGPRNRQAKGDIHHWQMGFKGMETGLLDIGDLRVDDQELEDSLSRFKEMFTGHSKEYAVANKGTLLVINTNCRLYEQLNTKVGANPYLCLPHLLAIYNEEVLRLAIEAFRRAQGNAPEVQIESDAIVMRECLHTYPLPNVFHYDHEKHLYNLCVGTRGIGSLRETATARLTRLDGTLGELRTSREKRFSLAMQVIGALLVVLTIITGYADIKLFPQKDATTYWSLAGGLFAIAMIINFVSRYPSGKFNFKTLRKFKLNNFITKFKRDWVQPLGYTTLMIAVVFFAIWILSIEGQKPPDKSGDATATPSKNQ
jgi:hypothetical protein